MESMKGRRCREEEEGADRRRGLGDAPPGRAKSDKRGGLAESDRHNWLAQDVL